MRKLLLFMPFLLTGAMPPGTGTLTIEIGNVRNAQGTVHVDICPEGRFLEDNCPYKGDAKSISGTTRVTVSGLAPGRYAVQAFHDENGNGEVDKVLFGIPKEGVGFSNDAKIRLGPPKFTEAAFDFERTLRIGLNMRYFTGPKGPRSTH